MPNNLGRDSLELRRKRNRLGMMYMFHNGLVEIDMLKHVSYFRIVRTSRHLHNLAHKVASSSINYVLQILILCKN